MSLSPSRRDVRKSVESASNSDPLTLSQALIITAGMAGLIGLCGGALLRFAFANSPDARFLNPLQTFPALSDWVSELPKESASSRTPADANSEYEGSRSGPYSEGFQAESTILTFESAEPIDSSQSSPIDESLDTKIDDSSKPADIATFDAFAARGNGRQRTAAPLDLLKKGPDLSGIGSGRSTSDRARQRPLNREELYDENAQGDIYDDSERYADEAYRGTPYYEDDNYNYDNYYPPTDESIDGNDAYYDEERW